MSRTANQSQAVILSGGGAYAAYEVGVMKALFTGESPATGHTLLNPGVLTGTSAGAVNASILASYPDADLCALVRFLEDVWVNRVGSNSERCGNGVMRFRGDPLRFFDPRCLADNPLRALNEFTKDGLFLTQNFFQHAVRFLISSGSIENRALQFIDVGAFVSSEPIRNMLPGVVSLEGIRHSERKLRIVATNWTKGEVRTFGNREMTDELGFLIIQASAAIPGIFLPNTIEGDLYVDGGVLMNTPLNCAIDAGANELHVIYLDPDVQNIPVRRLESTIEVFERIITITSATKVNEDIDTARWINAGLDVVERASRGGPLSDEDARAFIRVAGQIEKKIRAGTPYKKLTIHRYHPKDDLGGGALGLLNFDSDRIVGLIERGFNDALNHDCAESHCVLPARQARGGRPPARG
jgi:predicted acylesterase/phospholipase RssA